jgi:hypothetical protein
MQNTILKNNNVVFDASKSRALQHKGNGLILYYFKYTWKFLMQLHDKVPCFLRGTVFAPYIEQRTRR